jgi:hypothetical protein
MKSYLFPLTILLTCCLSNADDLEEQSKKRYTGKKETHKRTVEGDKGEDDSKLSSSL